MLDITATRNRPNHQYHNNNGPSSSSSALSPWTSWLTKMVFNQTADNTNGDDEKGTTPTSRATISPRLEPSLRRQVTTRIQLTRRGHLVLESRVADRLLEAIPMKAEPEFKTMRYTAVCCDADHFSTHGYTLRQQLKQRKTELMIVITLYNVII